MKTKICASLSIFALFFMGCDNSHKKVKGFEITPFIETSVILTDTTSVNKVYNDMAGSTMHDYKTSRGQEYFLNEVQFNEFIKMVSSMIKNPKSKIYFSDTPATQKEIKESIVMQQDSIDMSQFDAQGNEFIVRAAGSVDSTTAFSSIRQINFYESWAVNPENNIIEKKVLGYTLLQYIEAKGFYKTFFSVFKDEDALKTYKKYKRE
jgi:hypothetical protein